jgi:hypothetical protein
MKRIAKKLCLDLLIASALFASGSMFAAQAAQSSSSDKPQATATPASAQTSPSSAKPAPSAPAAQTSAALAKTPTSSANAAGVVWINTDTGVYHKQGTRWYGKTKHGKYMLEADAIKAGYKPAK